MNLWGHMTATNSSTLLIKSTRALAIYAEWLAVLVQSHGIITLCLSNKAKEAKFIHYQRNGMLHSVFSLASRIWLS
jgi:hypothetical protein